MRLHLLVIQRKQCASTATRRGIGKALAAQLDLMGPTSGTRSKRVVTHLYVLGFELHNTTTLDSWVLDTGCGTHICTVLQGLKETSPCKGIYETVECINNGNVILNVGSSNKLDKSKLWHSRLGHINKKRIAQLQKDGVLESFDFKSDDVCESCLLGKMTKSPFTGTCERGEGLLDLVHTDVCGPFQSATKDGKHYYVSKRSREPTGQKRKDKGYALETAAHILNLVPTKKVSKTPFEMWKGKRPSLGHIKIWGCEVFVRREAQDKLEARSEKCLFVGYPKESFGYLFYKPKDNVVFVARREVVTHVEPNDVSLPIRKTSRVSKPPQDPQFYYDFHIEEDKISDSTLSELMMPAIFQVKRWQALRLLSCKWIFKKKTNMDGKVHTYKARLVSKGYTQTRRIDYDETFSLMDVKTAFLNRKLTEDVFMAQPEGFKNEKYPKRFGFSRSEDESCVYVKVSGSVVVFLVLYVDDILLIGNDIPTLQSVKDWLGKCFAMKDLGDATYILGIKIYRDRTKRLIGLSQDTYLDKILKRFRMENSKKENLPLHHGIKISKDLCLKTNDELDKMSRVPYASAIGSIMYAMTCTRPDVSFALSMVSRHQQNPGEGHWTAVKNILRYLRNTKDMFLVYGGEKELRVTGYCDAGWQTDKDDSRSQSTCEASKEAIWMKNFIGDLGVVPTVQDPIEIFCDNESAVALTKEPKDHGKSKHIERKYHFVRSKVEEGHVIVKDIRSEDNPADPFTKALAKSKHDEHAKSIGLKDKIEF
ncbi:putative RNA-directed DNA polymerase [Tanacetum coccineum]